MAVEVRTSIGRLLDIVRLEEGVDPGGGEAGEGSATGTDQERRTPDHSFASQDDDFMRPTRDKPDLSDMYSSHYSPLHHPTLSAGSPVRDRSSHHPLPRTSPLRASHELGLTSLHGDTDSGISTRVRPSFSSLSPRTHSPAHDGLASSRSYDHHSTRSSRSPMRSSGGSRESVRSHSPMLRSGSSPPRGAPSAERKVSDLQGALEESEQRRVLLTQKLKDAQDTIEAQTVRLRTVESSAKDNTFTLEDMRYREKELLKRAAAAEKERDDQQRRRLDEARAGKRLQDKLESLESTISNLRLHKDQLQSEANNKKDVMDSVTATLSILEQENSKLTRAKESFTKELAAIKESLDIARSRNSWLENHSKETKGNVEKLRQENLKLAEEKRAFGAQLTELKKHNLMLKDESGTISTSMQGLKDEKFRVDHELGRLRAALADLQASLASTTSDKERYFREKLDLHQKVQQVTHDRDALLKSKTSVEEQLNDLREQVTEARRGMEKMRAERSSGEEEFAAVKKVGEVLSTELANARNKLEKATEQVAGMEQANKLSLQQQQLYQHEVRSMEKQVETLKKSMENLRKDNFKDKDSQEAHQLKLKEEVRHLKAERNQLELKVHELEARTKQFDTQLREQAEVGRRELDTWRRETEKVTASLGRRDDEVDELQNKVSELDEELSSLRVGQENHQAQYEELLESRDELLRLRDENRRMFQERGENQQVIQLLEMQKNILSKTSENNMGKANDAEQLQCKVDQLTAENNLLQDKNQEIERTRDALLKEKESQMWNSSDDEDSSPNAGQGRKGRGGQKQAIIDDLEQQNEQLQEVNVTVTEKLTRLEQENASMKAKQGDMLHRSEFQKVESARAALEQDLSRLRIQHEQLEQRYHEVTAERRIAKCEEVSAAQKEQEAVEARLALVKGDLVLAENAKMRLEERSSVLERQLEQATARAGNSVRDREHAAGLELRVAQLTSDLEGAHNVQAKQEQLITSLREQSLEDVGNELTNMRTELQKLLEVIQVKDLAIEDLEARLEDTRREIQDRDRTIEQLTSSIRSFGDLQGASQRTENDTSAIYEDAQNCSESTRDVLLQRISELEEERNDAGRVELLRTENRILQNQLSQNSRSGNVYISTANHDYPAFMAPPEEAAPEPPASETPQTTAAPTYIPPSPLNNSFDDTDDSTSLAYSLSENIIRERFETEKETFETITTEKDVSEAVALLGGISLADLDAPPPAKYQNLVDAALVQNDHYTESLTGDDDVTEESEQQHKNGQGNSYGGELTLADLESDIESTDMRRTPAIPGSSHVTRALRLADLDHKASDAAD